MNHSHILYDSDPHFKIDPISRNIIDESSKKVRLIQHDHNSERFTFEIPNEIEGHDMSSCNLVEIHYVNVGANTKIVRGGVYTVDDLQVKSDDATKVVFSWLIPNNATQYVGQLQFLIRFSCVNEDTAKVEYVWNTGIYSGITISSGIYNSDSQSDNPVPPYNFVTTIDGSMLKFYVASEEEYNKLLESGLVVSNCLYIITDDKTIEDTIETLEELEDVKSKAVGFGEIKEIPVPFNGIMPKFGFGTYQVWWKQPLDLFGTIIESVHSFGVVSYERQGVTVYSASSYSAGTIYTFVINDEGMQITGRRLTGEADFTITNMGTLCYRRMDIITEAG